MGSRIYALWPTKDKGETPSKWRLARFAQPPLHRSCQCWIGAIAGGIRLLDTGPCGAYL
jgi:hypothetical protein